MYTPNAVINSGDIAVDSIANRQRGHEDTSSGRPGLALLSTWHPEPADNGRKQRTRMLIRELARDHVITLISMLPSEAIALDHAPVPGVANQYFVPLPVTHARGLRALPGFASRYPRSLVETWDERTAARILEIVRDHNCEVALGTDLRTLRYLSALPGGVYTVLDEPDISPFIDPEARSARAALRERKCRWVISGSNGAINLFVAASHLELRALKAVAPRSFVRVIPNGVPDVPARPWSQPAGSRLLYTGSMTYKPNADAVQWFSDDILPKVQRYAPDAQLTVTGKLPRQPAPAGVHLAGVLPDLDGIVRASRLMVVPLRAGTGTRIKILEALAWGMPVVTTSKGAEGLPVVHSRHLLIADSPDEFARAITELLNDPERCLDLGSSGRRLIERHFTWGRIGERLRTLVSDRAGMNVQAVV